MGRGYTVRNLRAIHRLYSLAIAALANLVFVETLASIASRGGVFHGLNFRRLTVLSLPHW